MKKTELINSDISAVIAKMGHTDSIVIGDCGLPIPSGPKRIDLAVVRNLPGFFEVLEAVLNELCVEKVTIASEMEDISPEAYAKISEKFSNVEIATIPHEEFKEMTKDAKAVVRTGECTPYLNVILFSGVKF